LKLAEDELEGGRFYLKNPPSGTLSGAYGNGNTGDISFKILFHKKFMGELHLEETTPRSLVQIIVEDDENFIGRIPGTFIHTRLRRKVVLCD
jgi:hypothetical protein